MSDHKHAIDGALDGLVEKLLEGLRIAPLILVLAVGGAGYWIWTQSSHLDHICHNLFAAFDDTARGPSHHFTLDFESTVALLEGMPTLRDAAKRCHEVRDYRSTYDVLLER